VDIFEEFKKLLEMLRRENLPYALCGGLALAVYGITRATEDIDLIIEESSLPRIRELAASLGFRFDPRPMVFKEDAVRIYRMYKTEGEDFLVLDLLLVTESTKAAWEGRRQVQTQFGTVWVVSPPGLIHLKTFRGSAQDQEDIRKLKELRDEG
jgi:hypothetical protein